MPKKTNSKAADAAPKKKSAEAQAAAGQGISPADTVYLENHKAKEGK